MTDDEQPRRMTTDEIALMREIVRWRRSQRDGAGLSTTEFVRRRVYGTPYWKDQRTGREVWFNPTHEDPMSIIRARGEWGDVIPTSSVTEAVDILVAYGFLPARFSSAYMVGWDVGMGHYAGPDPAVLR